MPVPVGPRISNAYCVLVRYRSPSIVQPTVRDRRLLDTFRVLERSGTRPGSASAIAGSRRAARSLPEPLSLRTVLAPLRPVAPERRPLHLSRAVRPRRFHQAGEVLALIHILRSSSSSLPELGGRQLDVSHHLVSGIVGKHDHMSSLATRGIKPVVPNHVAVTRVVLRVDHAHVRILHLPGTFRHADNAGTWRSRPSGTARPRRARPSCADGPAAATQRPRPIQPTLPLHSWEWRRTSLNGLVESKLGSRGSPSTRSPIPLRCISFVPAAIAICRQLR